MQISLSAQLRTEFGKTLNKYRKNGKIPGNVYEKHNESSSIWLNKTDVEKLLSRAHEGSFIDLILENKKISAIVRDVMYEHRKGSVIHIQFEKIDIKEKVTVEIPIEMTGASLAEKNGLVIENPLKNIEIEALPSDIPEKIIVDISKLENEDDRIIAKDINIAKGVTMLTGKDEVVVAVVKPSMQEEEQHKQSEVAQVNSVQSTRSKKQENA